MRIFKISFDGFKRCRGSTPATALIPAHMAYQLQESPLSWVEFCWSPAAQSMTFETVVKHLLKIHDVASARELTILLLIDSLQAAGDALPTLLSNICDLTNSSIPFVMIACSSSLQIPIRDFLCCSGQLYISLTPPPISEPQEIANVCKRLASHEDRLMAKLMIQDMGGHGRALEYLQQLFDRYVLASVLPSKIMNEVKVYIKAAYSGWNPIRLRAEAAALLTAILEQTKLSLHSIIPGTERTVDQILQVGLFRFDDNKGILSAAYIWMMLMIDWIDLPELKTPHFDYNKIKEDIQNGEQASLLPLDFEHFSRKHRNFSELSNFFLPKLSSIVLEYQTATAWYF